MTPSDTGASASAPTHDFPSRPVTGFFALLTPEQQAAALAYDGPEDFGPDEFRLDTLGPTEAIGVSDPGLGEGRQRQDEGLGEATAPGHYLIGVTLPDGSNVELPFDPAAAWAIAHHQVEHALDAAAAVMAADPWSREPLAGSEAWEEGDEAYAERLDGHFNQHHAVFFKSGITGVLDKAGMNNGLPRARLVLVEV